MYFIPMNMLPVSNQAFLLCLEESLLVAKPSLCFTSKQKKRRLRYYIAASILIEGLGHGTLKIWKDLFLYRVIKQGSYDELWPRQ
jgi:hypothetical protein